MIIRSIFFATLLAISPLISFATDDYVATSNLNVRTGASIKTTVSFTIQKGSEVEVLSKNGSWYKIKYLGKIGYADSKYLKSIPDTAFSQSQHPDIDDSGLIWVIIAGLIVFFWLLPFLIIVSSGRTTSGEKIGWILAVLFISWFAWIFYMLLAPIKKKS